MHEKIIPISYFYRVLPIIVNGSWNAMFSETVNKLMQKFVSKCYIPELVIIRSFFSLRLSIST